MFCVLFSCLLCLRNFKDICFTLLYPELLRSFRAGSFFIVLGGNFFMFFHFPVSVLWRCTHLFSFKTFPMICAYYSIWLVLNLKRSSCWVQVLYNATLNNCLLNYGKVTKLIGIMRMYALFNTVHLAGNKRKVHANTCSKKLTELSECGSKGLDTLRVIAFSHTATTGTSVLPTQNPMYYGPGFCEQCGYTTRHGILSEQLNKARIVCV